MTLLFFKDAVFSISLRVLGYQYPKKTKFYSGSYFGDTWNAYAKSLALTNHFCQGIFFRFSLKVDFVSHCLLNPQSSKFLRHRGQFLFACLSVSNKHIISQNLEFQTVGSRNLLADLWYQNIWLEFSDLEITVIDMIKVRQLIIYTKLY